MAEENIIIFKTQIEGLESIDQLNKQLAEARKQYKENQAGSEKYIEAVAKITEVNGKLDSHKQFLKQVDNQSKSNSNTIEGLRNRYKELAAATVKLDIGSNEFQQTQAEAKRVSDQLKELEKGMGNTSRNVGNYAEGFKEALSGLGGGLGNAVKGVMGFNAALAANPIGAVVQAITFLTNALSGNAEVADFVERAMAGLNKIFQVVVDTVVNFSKSLSIAFSNPKQAILDLINLIKDNLLNRFKAFAVIARGIADGDLKAVGNGFLQLSTGVEDVIGKVQKAGKALGDAGKAGFDAAKQLDEYTVSLARNESAMQINSARIQALEKDLKNVGLSLQQRKKIANELADLEIKNASLAGENAKAVLKAEDLKLKGKSLNAAEEAQLIKLNTAVTIAEEEKKIAIAQRSRRIAQLLAKEESAERKKAAEEAQIAARKDKEIAELEKLRKGQKDYDKYVADRNQRDAKAKRDLEQLKRDEEEKTLRAQEDSLPLTQDILDRRYKAELKAIQETQDAYVQSVEFKNMTENEQLLATEKFNEQRLNAQINYNKQSEKLIKEKIEWEKMNETQKADYVLGVMKNFQASAALLGEEGKAIQKALGISSAIIETYKGASIALGTYGFPLGPIFAASVIGAGLANVASIAAAAGGGDFVTTKPTLLLVGDNPGGRERVTVEPLSGRGQTKIGNSGLIAMAGGGSLSVNPSGMSAISSTASSDVMNQLAMSKSITDTFAKLGNPVVSVVDIKKVSNKTTVTENKARLRA